jgi:hypothetical protein
MRYEQAPDIAPQYGPVVPLGKAVRRSYSAWRLCSFEPGDISLRQRVDYSEPALSSKRSQSQSPEETIGTATKKPLSLQYAELMRLRKAVQEAAATQSENRRPRNGHGALITCTLPSGSTQPYGHATPQEHRYRLPPQCNDARKTPSETVIARQYLDLQKLREKIRRAEISFGVACAAQWGPHGLSSVHPYRLH